MPASAHKAIIPTLCLVVLGTIVGIMHSFVGFEQVESMFIVGSTVLGVVLLAVLAAFRVSIYTLLLYAYLAVPFYANRILGAVWLGSPTELSAGTFTPLLFGDAVLLIAITRYAGRFPIKIALLAGLLLVPSIALFLNSEFYVGAFAYQYLSLLRSLTVGWLIYRALTDDRNRFSASSLTLHLGIIFSSMAILSAIAAIFTGGRFGLPGWGGNVLANALCVIGVLNFHAALREKKFVHFLLALVCLFGLIGTGTRVALVVFLAAFLVLLLSMMIPTPLRRVGLPIFVGSLITIVVLFPGPMLGLAANLGTRADTIGNLELSASTTWPELVPALAAESSGRTRLQLWGASLAMVVAQPLTGVGWGQWNWLKAEYGVEFDVLLDPHNGYLWLLSESGIVIFLILTTAAIVMLVRTPITSFHLALALMLVLEVTNSNLQKPLYSVMAGSIIGALLATQQLLRLRRVIPPSSEPQLVPSAFK